MHTQQIYTQKCGRYLNKTFIDSSDLTAEHQYNGTAK
jgi:hypothetical protein